MYAMYVYMWLYAHLGIKMAFYVPADGDFAILNCVRNGIYFDISLLLMCCRLSSFIHFVFALILLSSLFIRMVYAVGVLEVFVLFFFIRLWCVLLCIALLVSISFLVLTHSCECVRSNMRDLCIFMWIDIITTMKIWSNPPKSLRMSWIFGHYFNRICF